MIIRVANIGLNHCIYTLKKKISVINRLNLLVRKLNMNEYGNEEKLYGISTNLIRKLTDLFLQ